MAKPHPGLLACSWCSRGVSVPPSAVHLAVLIWGLSWHQTGKGTGCSLLVTLQSFPAPLTVSAQLYRAGLVPNLLLRSPVSLCAAVYVKHRIFSPVLNSALICKPVLQ